MILGAVELVPADSATTSDDPRLGRRRRRLGVHANADTPADAAKAREFGAEGIGLCRTEHMFFGEEHLPACRR